MVEGLLIVRKIEKEKVVQVLENAILAPSGSNTQPWAFIIIESEETKENSKFLIIIKNG
ncbi:nitroreductase family protein [Sedimentibacter saalensis]|uniref:nitroreductase family protein n=1 Tax=Sedimentibacter saalensis TaxID=130788 RepID=UPI00396A6622